MKQITATSLLNKELIDGVRPSHLGNKELLEIITNLNLNNMPKKIISDEQFCKMCTSYYGELVDSVKQIVSHTFTGVELKEFVEHPTKPGYRRHDVLKKIHELETKLIETQIQQNENKNT